MYNSQYYTCEQIDERLLQGYLDDYNSQTGQSLTKAQFLTKLGSLFSKEGTIDNTLTQIGYYECDTAAGTAAKVITVASYSLFAGGSMKVKFVNKNTANNATLNINSQGAKALYYNGVRVSSTNTWDAGEVVEIYYDGTSYYANNVKGSTGDGVFDISVYNPTEGQPTPYADLATALGPNGQNVPVQYRKGGMSIKFVQSSDNNYVQYRLMADEWSTDTDNWSVYGDEILVENPEFIAVFTDKNKKILFGVKSDSDFYFGKGCPKQIRDYVLLHKEEILSIVAGKVDKEDGKGLIQIEVAESISFIENPEYMEVETDSSQKVLGGRKYDGTKFENMPVETPVSKIFYIDSPEWIFIETTAHGGIIKGIKKDGRVYESVTPSIRNIFDRTEGISGILQHYSFDYFPDNKYLPMMVNLNRKEISGSTGIQKTYSNLVLAGITDTHNKNTYVKNFLKFVEKYKYYISDCIHMGDLVATEFPNPFDSKDIAGFNNILLTLGNHDAYVEHHQSFSDVVSASDAYNKFFSDRIANWGVEYTAGDCYYYKDYVAQKIRLIVLDCMHWDATQKEWLNDVLTDARDVNDSYQVIISQHIPPCTDTSKMNFFDCSWNSKDDVSIYHTYYYDSVELVDDFQSNGGVFIMWLFGHWHIDGVGTFVDYPNQLFVVQAQTAADNANDGWRDMARVDGMESENCFNVYSIDPLKKYIRVARVGAEYDRNLQHKGSMLLSYNSENIGLIENF